jgi:hypothetical protein
MGQQVTARRRRRRGSGPRADTSWRRLAVGGTVLVMAGPGLAALAQPALAALTPGCSPSGTEVTCVYS